ncbi:Crp/Fnr family transcriptional regulator [Campylobacter sp. RM13119]|uniref:Crp/Fnr family transcriptional regulator n=1 Tax=Campylobacter californiensis TaxID=1032243 RepID=UPI001475F25E|nr:Crp/Fnr family transcriptional regulator [Campylobacter sp. RM13119]MBE3605714.1 Crp/Fnr family transcriptional regulator [Campylobacter sp. RM13119]
MLDKISIFKNLSKEQLEELEEITLVKKYKKGEFLFIEGEEPKWLIYLLSGSIKLYKTTQNGKEIFLHQLPPMNFVAEMVNFENIPYPASAIFVVSGEVLKIDYEKFKAKFLNDPKICMNLIKSMSEKLRITSNLLHQELILNSEAKVAKFILMHEDLFNELKHTKIASILNITPETFSRILNKFKTLEIIKLSEKNEILEKNVDKLTGIYSL